MPKLIIIPGAGSSELNWLDQLIYFQKLNFNSHFLEYRADAHESMSKCALELATTLLDHLENPRQNISSAPRSHLERDPTNKIIAHSMGAMLLLKILSESHSISIYQELRAALSTSEIFLIQCPPSTNPKLLSFLKSFKRPVSRIMHLHQPLKEPVKEKLESLKRDFLNSKFDKIFTEGNHEDHHSEFSRKYKLRHSPLEQLKDLSWILSAMHISAWGTQPPALDNLINYYEEWYSESITEKELDHLHELNIHLSVSNSDIFCDKNDSLKLANKLNAKVKHFDWTFHNPMHFPWSKNSFNQWILNPKHS